MAPSGTELAKKTFAPGSSNASLAALGKRGAAAGQLECRQPTVSCSFTFEGRNRRGGHADHKLSKFLPRCGGTVSGGEPDRNSWLVISNYNLPPYRFSKCCVHCNQVLVGFSASCGFCACQQKLEMTDCVPFNRSAVEAQPMLHSCGPSPLGKVRTPASWRHAYVCFTSWSGRVLFCGCHSQSWDH